MEALMKDKRIKKEILKYKKILANVEPERKKAVEKLIENAAFMAATLDDLQAEINENGCIEKYKNGENQYGYKESTAFKAYNSLIKNYNVTVKQLLDQLPEEIIPSSGGGGNGDGFDQFVRKKGQA